MPTNILIAAPTIIPVIGSFQDYEGAIDASGIVTESGLTWLLLDGTTIGNSGSGATRYADAKAQVLFEKLWSNPNLNIFTSTGFATTKGASATADFNALKRLSLPDPRGRVIVPAGAGAGLTSRVRGQLGGAETHTLASTETPSHDHLLPETVISDRQEGYINSIVYEQGFPTGVIPKTSSVGGGQSHNNMQPYYVCSGKLILAGRA